MEELDSVVETQEVTVDDILGDVAKVQEVLQSHCAEHRIDINEIYEKLEELMYLKREERVEYVATQLLYKSGVIVETSVVPEERVFRFSQENEGHSDQVVPNDDEYIRTHVFEANGEATDGADGVAAQTFSNVTNTQNELDGEIHRLDDTCYEVTDRLAKEATCINSMFPQSDFGQIYAFLEVYKDEDRRMQIVTDELLLSRHEDKINEVKQNNTGMLSVAQPCQAANADCNVNVSNDVTNDAKPDDTLEQAGCTEDPDIHVGEESLSYQTLLRREAAFIHDILPGFEYEEILACLDVHKDIEIVTDELLKINMERADSELKEESTKMAPNSDELQSSVCGDSISASSVDTNPRGDEGIEPGSNDDLIQVNCTLQESSEESAHLIDFSSDFVEAESSIKTDDLIDLTCSAVRKEGDNSFDTCLIVIENDGDTAEVKSENHSHRLASSNDEHYLSFDMIAIEEAQNLPDALPLTVSTGTLINVECDNEGAALETDNDIEISTVSNGAEQLNESGFIIIEHSDVKTSDILNKSSEQQNLRQLHEIFPDADMNYLTTLSLQSQSIDDMVNEVLKHEDGVVPEPGHSGVSQGCRKKTITYEEFLSALPNVDPVFLAEIWHRIGNDYTAVKKFIAEQQEEASGDSHYHTLLSLLPQADPAFLREKCHVIGDNEAALQEFIEEQLRDGSQEQYNTLLAMFPQADSAYLRQKCIEIGNDEAAMRAFIVEQLKYNEGDNIYQNLLAMFPDADHEYLRRNIERIGDDEDAMRFLITEQLEEMEGVKFQTLLAVLPDADPEYLQEMLNNLGSNEEGIKVFLMEAIENRDYPTREDYLKRQEMSALKRKYRDDFSVEDFLEAIPDPPKYFTKKNNSNKVVQQHAHCYLQARYRAVPQEQLTAAFQNNSFNLMLTCRELDARHEPDLHCELITCMQMDIKDIPMPFLQEVAYIENEQKIKDFLTMKEQRKKEAFEWAKLNGELLECGCCYDAEVMAEDMAPCTEGHLFCKECVKKSAEVMIGYGKNSFPCLTACVAEFSLRVIQSVLKPVVFSRMLQRKQLEEVQAAGIEDLESCPFCDFATIPPADDKLFSCFNPDCMRDSCRKCKRQSHIPLRCDEVETKEVKMRTFIEDRMTDALVRSCWQCKKKFIKEAGCNKMTCTCGALMCYICRKAVTDYTHFNGQGGTEFNKCPLYSDIQVIHDVAVQEEGAKAKKEIQEQNPTIELKHDPTQFPNP